MATLRVWFDSFVQREVLRWRRSRPSVRENPYVGESKTAAFTSTEVGDFGEADVEARLERLGYVAARTPGSRTPGDVWSIGHVGELVHVALVQVRATAGGGKPAGLSRLDRDALTVLAKFVSDAFDAGSDEHPSAVAGREHVVSAGYAGVNVREHLKRSDRIVTSLVSTEFVIAYGDEAALSSRFFQRAEAVHRFAGALSPLTFDRE